MRNRKDRAFVLSFGLAGHGIDALTESIPGSLSESHLSGYEDPEGFEKRFSEYSNYDFSRTIVVDKRAALEERPFRAFESPLVSCKLAADEVSACPIPDPLFAGALASDPGNSFAGLLALQTIHKTQSAQPGPLDSVSPSAYAAWWKANGARIGRIVDARIVWEDTNV